MIEPANFEFLIAVPSVRRDVELFLNIFPRKYIFPSFVILRLPSLRKWPNTPTGEELPMYTVEVDGIYTVSCAFNERQKTSKINIVNPFFRSSI